MKKNLSQKPIGRDRGREIVKQSAATRVMKE